MSLRLLSVLTRKHIKKLPTSCRAINLFCKVNYFKNSLIFP